MAFYIFFINLEQHRTPEVCLQAVMSNPNAKEFVPNRFSEPVSNVYDFYNGKLKDELWFGYKDLSFEQVQKIFNGETVNVIGMKFGNLTLRDFSINFDKKEHKISTKKLNETPEKKQSAKLENKPKKRKGIKM